MIHNKVIVSPVITEFLRVVYMKKMMVCTSVQTYIHTEQAQC